jgi:hypothetical protein
VPGGRGVGADPDAARACIGGLDGQRLPQMERAVEKIFHKAPAEPSLTLDERLAILKKDLEPMLSREIQHRWVVVDGILLRTDRLD